MMNFKHLFRIKDTREAQARGLAIGFFWGVSMFWGAQILGAVLCAQLVKGNKVLAAAMTAISNPLTTIPLYSFCYLIGHLFVPGPDLSLVISKIHSFDEMLKMGASFFWSMFIGTSVVGIIGSVIVYFLVKRLRYDSVDTV